MLREIIRPTSENYNIHIPKEYIDTEVEILVLPFTYYGKLNKKENISKTRKSLAGSLKEYANVSLIENEKDIAWSEVIKDKNDIS